MKRLLSLILIFCLLLAGCQSAPAEETQGATEPPEVTAAEAVTDAPDATVVEAVTGDDTTVQVITGRHPLNGAPMDENLYTLRPFAFSINNSSAAQPLCTIASTDILVELRVEGGITRFIAVYSDISELEHIGPIRSARPHLIEAAESFDAIFVHHGCASPVTTMELEFGTDVVDAMRNGGGAFYRDQSRLNSGYALEHTSFADGEDIIAKAEALELPAQREEGVYYGYQFGDNGSTENGQAATQIGLNFEAKTTKITYDQATGRYGMEQYGSVFKDGNTGEAVTFRNVVILQTACYMTQVSTGVLSDADMRGQGTGYFACDGKVVPILWHREGLDDPFTVTHEDGTPITLGVGNSYFGIVPTGDNVDIT